MRNYAAFLFAIMLSFPAAGAPDKQRVQFAFHSTLLMNLHHFLYDAVTRAEQGPRPEWQLVGNAADRLALEEAVAFYRSNYADADLLGDRMHEIRTALSVADDQINVRGLALPPALGAVLERAAPAYARTIWPVHERANRRWIRQAVALDTVFGEQIENTIERHLKRSFTSRAIRVDAVFNTGTFPGAYTSDEPQQATLSSDRADYQGLAALEMLYHEAAHTGVIGAVEAAIAARLKANGRADASQLWHAVHFYTVGEVVRKVLKQRGNIDYQPYADKRGLFQRPYRSFAPLLATFWRPYMEGTSSFADATNGMVDQLPPQ